MRLRYSCSICKASNYFTPKAPTRADLQMKFGSDEVQVNCKHCGKLEKKHINKISGTADNRMILIGLGIGVIVGITVLLFYGFIGVVALAIPLLFWAAENKAVGEFNRYRIRKK